MSSSLSATRPTDGPLRVLAGKCRHCDPSAAAQADDHRARAERDPAAAAARAERNQRPVLAPDALWSKGGYAFRGGYCTARTRALALNAG